MGAHKDWSPLRKLAYKSVASFLTRQIVTNTLLVIINETLTWSDYVDYISTKVNQRLGILRRIKHLLPIQTRELYIKSMILPLFNYSDVVWGDKHNKTLMAKLQLLQNKAAKSILDKATHSSVTEAINELDWLVLSERRREFKLIHLRDTHSYNARHKHNFEMPKSRCQKGQERLTYQVIHEWNALPISTRNSIWFIWEAYKNYFIYFKIVSTLSWDFTVIVCSFNF